MQVLQFPTIHFLLNKQFILEHCLYSPLPSMPVQTQPLTNVGWQLVIRCWVCASDFMHVPSSSSCHSLHFQARKHWGKELRNLFKGPPG